MLNKTNQLALSISLLFSSSFYTGEPFDDLYSTAAVDGLRERAVTKLGNALIRSPFLYLDIHTRRCSQPLITDRARG